MTKREFVNIMQEKLGTQKKREAWVAKVQATGWPDYHFAEDVLMETFQRILEKSWYRGWSVEEFSFSTIRRFISLTAKEMHRKELEADGAEIRQVTTVDPKRGKIRKREREVIHLKKNWDFRTPLDDDQVQDEHDTGKRTFDNSWRAEEFLAQQSWESECQERHTDGHEPRPLPSLENCLPFFGPTEREVLLKLFEAPPAPLEDIARQYPSRPLAFWSQWWAQAQTLLGIARKCREWTFTQDEAQFVRHCIKALTWPTEERQHTPSSERLHRQMIVGHLVRGVAVWPAMADYSPPISSWAAWLYTKAPQDVKARRLRFLNVMQQFLTHGVSPILASPSR